MKGHFSIEWLSQSSQATCVSDFKAPTASWHTVELEGPSTYSTPPRSLPGWNCRKMHGSTEPQERPEAKQEPHQTTSLHPEPTCGSLAKPYSNVLATDTEEETSGYESEGGRSLSPAAPKDVTQTSLTTGRRPRTAFTTQQISRLERAFKRHAYLGTHDKAELCKKLNLSDKQIRNWFQNRRMKLKRTLQDTLAQACQTSISSQLMHYSELQPFGSATYPTYYCSKENQSSHVSPSKLGHTPSPVGDTIPTMTTRSFHHQYNTLPSFLVSPRSGSLTPPYYLYPPHY